MSNYLPRFLESEGSPSIRLACGLLVVLAALGLEARFAIADNAKEFVDSNFLFAATLFGIGSARMVATAFAKREPESATTINAEVAPVSADTVNVNSSEN